MIDGALLLDKPVGLSSNAALQSAKRIFGARKAGHAGTLDPLASGLLVILFGEATKLAGPALDADKEYQATIKLGERTATGDAEGEIIERKPFSGTEESVRKALECFRGEISQLPPMHSALKRDGVPLYKLARRGETVERKPRSVRILRLDLLRFEPPKLEIRLRCSKGTYVRTLAEDIGAALGTAAHLSALRRTASGRFLVTDAVSLERLREMSAAARERELKQLSSLLEDLPRAELDAPSEARLRNGQALKISGLCPGLCAVYGPGGAVVGLGRAQSGVLRPLRLTQAAEKHVKSRA